MKSAPPEPSDLVNRLRQQLILAQVRIMELEDARDSLAPRVAELEQLLQAAQTLADQKLDEAAHLGKVLAEAQTRGEQLNQLYLRIGGELSGVVTKLDQREARVQQLEKSLQQLESELQTLKSSRSWRWTAWLRSLAGKP
jgi:chromosome segregation ATPase